MAASGSASDKDWDYVGQLKDWQLEKERLVTTLFQSPIDIPLTELLRRAALDADAQGKGKVPRLQICYNECPTRYAIHHKPNRSITVTTVCDDDTGGPRSMGHITVDGKRFDVAEFHFHAPAEHVFDGGERRILEMHIVHRFAGYEGKYSPAISWTDVSQPASTSSSGTTWITEQYGVPHEDEMVVLGITFSVEAASVVSSGGSARNKEQPPLSPAFEFLQAVLDVPNFPWHEGQYTEIDVAEVVKAKGGQQPYYDLRSVVFAPQFFSAVEKENRPANAQVRIARYFGSLTLPPFTEAVNWCLKAEPVCCEPNSLGENILASLSTLSRYPGTGGNFRVVQGVGTVHPQYGCSTPLCSESTKGCPTTSGRLARHVCYAVGEAV